MHFAGTTPRLRDWNPRGSLLGSCSKILRKVTACSSKVVGRFQQGSSKIPGKLQARFQQGSRKVPACKVPGRFQQGSSKVPARFQEGSSKVPSRFQEGSSKVALNSCKHVYRSPLLLNVLDVSVYFLIQYNNSSVVKSVIEMYQYISWYNTITAVHEWLCSKWHLNWPVLREGTRIYIFFFMKQTPKLAYTWSMSVLSCSSHTNNAAQGGGRSPKDRTL